MVSTIVVDAFGTLRSIQKQPTRGGPTAVVMHMTLDNFKDDIDLTSSESESPSPSITPESSLPTEEQQVQPQLQRPHRSQQIENIQGVWWTSERKDQLVEIRSSYAIFDALQNTYVSTTSPMPPAVAYPLGGTEDIVTLRTFKLAVPPPTATATTTTTPSPQWIPSPTSKVSVQRGGGTAIGIESPSIQTVSPNPSTSFVWEPCQDPQTYWKSDRVVQGYEKSLTPLLASEGPHWSASPVDVLRAVLEWIQARERHRVHTLCRFPDPGAATRTVRGRDSTTCDGQAVQSIAEQFESGVASWSIVQCHHFSPDVCTLKVSIHDHPNQASTKTFEFCLSRDTQKPRTALDKDDANDSLPASRLFHSIMDVELLIHGKTWAIDHITECPCE